MRSKAGFLKSLTHDPSVLIFPVAILWVFINSSPSASNWGHRHRIQHSRSCCCHCAKDTQSPYSIFQFSCSYITLLATFHRRGMFSWTIHQELRTFFQAVVSHTGFLTLLSWLYVGNPINGFCFACSQSTNWSRWLPVTTPIIQYSPSHQKSPFQSYSHIFFLVTDRSIKQHRVRTWHCKNQTHLLVTILNLLLHLISLTKQVLNHCTCAVI